VIPLLTAEGRRLLTLEHDTVLRVADDVRRGARASLVVTATYGGVEYEVAFDAVPLDPMPAGAVRLVAEHPGVSVAPTEIREVELERRDNGGSKATSKVYSVARGRRVVA
jgi:hypothetical protein